MSRVYFVCHDVADRGGQERVSAEVLSRLADDWDIVVIARQIPARLRGKVSFVRVKVPAKPFVLKFALFYILAGLALMAELAKAPGLVCILGSVVPNRSQFSIVHFCHAGYTDGGRVLAPASLRGSRRAYASLARRLSLLSERWTFRPTRTGKLIAVSQGIASEIRRWYPDIDISVVPNGVDPTEFKPDSAVYLARDVPEGNKVVLFVGGDWHRKGLPLLIEAMAHLPANYVLWVVGPGDERAMRSTVTGGESSRLKFFGRQNEVATYMQMADVFVLPSAYEAAPLVGFEAAAVALPIVTTEVHGLAEFVTDHRAGFVVARDVLALVNGIISAASSETAGPNARAGALAQTWDESASQTAALWNEAVR